MRIKLLALVAAPLTALAITTPAQASHSWNGYHWARMSNPFTLKVGDNVSSTWDTYLDTSISDWNASRVLDLTKVTGAAKGRRCRPTSGRIEVCNATYGNNGWLGLASINVSGKHITAGTTKVNDTYFNTAKYNTPAWRNLVMCQEIGHDFGLDHQDEDMGNPNLGTCMDYTNNPETNQHPNQHDFDQLEEIYSHLDSTTTVDASAARLPQVSDAPSSWGQLVAGSRASGRSTYVRDFGQGQHVVTHVIWAR
jgi:hypothetical protein